jgi:hypothetical protein
MRVKDRVLNYVAGDYIEKEVKRKLAESYPMGEKPEDSKWRRITDANLKDLKPLKMERMLKTAYHLWENNPMAHRIIEMTKDFVIGEGITYTADHEDVKDLLDDFWDDPVNLWDLKQHNKAMELGLYGEQIYPVEVNEMNGKVRLGYIDPLQVKKVVHDSRNCEIIREIQLKRQGNFQPPPLKVIQVNTDANSENAYRMEGDCFYFRINAVTNAPRGSSDLWRVSDWIDGYDEFLNHRLDRAQFINNFVWDITFEGLDQEAIDKLMELPQFKNPPLPGTYRAHNEAVKYEALTPNLQAHDASEEARLIKNNILGGLGIPEHWYAEGGNANRATAAEMGLPIIKRLMTRQRYFRYMIEYIFQFVVDQAVIKGNLAGVPENEMGFTVSTPQISVDDSGEITTALKNVSGALIVAEDQEWISKETARQVYASVCYRLGFEYDLDKEAEKIKAEGQNNPSKDYPDGN